MNSANIIYRKIKPEDASGGYMLSNESGWNQTQNDWKFIIGMLPISGYVAEVDNKIIGTAISINYATDFSWICMVLVSKSFRRQGISSKLLHLLLEKLGNTKIIKLDATDEGKQVYTKLGFKPEYTIHRMVWSEKTKLNVSPTKKFEDITNDLIPKISFIDKLELGVERKKLFEHYLNQPLTTNICTGTEGGLSYLFSRKGNKYLHLGPLHATQESIAKELILAVIEHSQEVPVLLDVLDRQSDFILWLESIGFQKQRSFTRMWKIKNVSEGDHKNQFLVFGPEFG